jgi:hypothetical protein
MISIIKTLPALAIASATLTAATIGSSTVASAERGEARHMYTGFTGTPGINPRPVLGHGPVLPSGELISCRIGTGCTVTKGDRDRDHDGYDHDHERDHDSRRA